MGISWKSEEEDYWALEMHGAEAGLRSDVPDVEGASLFFGGHPQPLPFIVESADLGAMG